ncbi:MAG: hypothetical protein CL609_01015 [Anaerolineaceae bacterium]|nr:hypothetical protein [Anaerolineaceae bacterium]
MKRNFLLAFFILVLLITFLPFLVPVNELHDTVPVEDIITAPSQLIELDHFTAHVRVLGSGEQKIVLLHGFGSTLNTWNDMQLALAKNMQVISMDLPGYGLTRANEKNLAASNYDIYNRAEFVIEILDTLDIKKAVFVGNSAGGKLAAYIAANYPERVDKLILVDPAIFGGGIPPFLSPLFHTPQMDHLGPLFARFFIKQWVNLVCNNRHHPEDNLEDWLNTYQQPQLIHDWDVELWKQIQYSAGVLPESVLMSIQIPTLVLNGEFDQIVKEEDSRKVQYLIGGAEFQLIPNSAHLPQEENPAALVQLIADFIR